jgi:predicted lipoprotein with Yx(FWY)xxD motif
MRTFLVVIALLTVLAVGSPSVARPAAGSVSLTVRDSTYGKILFDGRGFVLYAFTRDGRGGGSGCYGDCAKAWPPFLVQRAARAGNGASSSLVGTTKRRDGRLQVTYAGRPLYYYVGDRKPGQILCQNVVEFGGTWLVVRASGRVVR